MLQGKTVSSSYYKDLYDKYVQVMSRYKDEQTKYSGTLCCYDMNIKDMSLNSDMDNLIEADFEFIKVPIVAHYDETLTRMYGDWHKFVKGTSWHTFIMVDPHKSYLNVFKERGL
jgi:hypothetical protein